MASDASRGVLDELVSDVVSRVRFDSAGLVPAIVQQWDSGEVLMVAWMDEAALRATLTDQRGTYFSRSRGRQWVKGETSGNTQRVLGVHLDCDADAILVQVDQHGPACHTGEHSCFDVEGHQSGTAGTDGR
jgi:phosphoribosyl-AMP cyclohydrolase